MNLVIDSSIIIDYLRGGKVWNKLLAEVSRTAIFYIPTIVVYELFSGQSTKQPEIVRKIEGLLGYYEKIELTERIARSSGELRRDHGKELGPADYIIAASALELNAQILTLNQKHFAQIPGLSLYPI